MWSDENPFTLGIFLICVLLVGAASFYAPCGCYAGTAVKDVPLRCIEEKR